MKVNFYTTNIYQNTGYGRNRVSFGHVKINKIKPEISADMGRVIKEIKSDADISVSSLDRLSEKHVPYTMHHRSEQEITASRERSIAMLIGEDYELEGDEFLERLMY